MGAMVPGNPDVRSVMFIGSGGFGALEEGRPYQGDMQLHAAVDLLEFANAYILNDCTIIGGNVGGGEYVRHDFLSEFINTEIESAGSIAVVGSPPRVKGATSVYNIEPFLQAVELETLGSEVTRLQGIVDDLEKRFSRMEGSSDQLRQNLKNAYADEKRVATKLRARQMQSYMLFADTITADIVPEYIYGIEAIQTYPALLAEKGKTVSRKGVHEHFDKLSSEIVRRLAAPVEHSQLELLRQPCFLVEALRTVDTFEGLGHALRELRASDAATNYRELNRARLYAPSLHERSDADKELRLGVSERFKEEGFDTKIPGLVKIVAALSALGVQYFIPELHYTGEAVAIGIEGVEVVRKFIRKRRCPFLGLFNDNSGEIFVQLQQKFPGLAFSPEELAARLATRKDALRPLLKV